jgi:predicted nucleic acid-binding protein
VVAIESSDWVNVVDAGSVPPVIQAWDLGPGESAVLAWATAHPGAEAILDDLAARRCAASLAVPVRGTLGLVLLAKRRGMVPAARPLLDTLREAGMYLSPAVMDRALRLVGE